MTDINEHGRFSPEGYHDIGRAITNLLIGYTDSFCRGDAETGWKDDITFWSEEFGKYAEQVTNARINWNVDNIDYDHPGELSCMMLVGSPTGLVQIANIAAIIMGEPNWVSSGGHVCSDDCFGSEYHTFSKDES